MIVVSDSSPLISLSKIKYFSLLKDLFNKIIIPSAVFQEIVITGEGKPGAKETNKSLNKWIKIAKVKDSLAVQVLLSELERGEAESIILAKELNADLLLIDDDKAKTKAKLSGLRVRGTVGILVMGYEAGLVRNLEQSLNELQKKGFWIEEKILKEVTEMVRKGS